MKPIKYTWVAWLFIVLTASQCKKDKEPVGQLPPETQSGANTFGCLVNGTPWIPKGTEPYSGTNVTAYYQHIYATSNGYVFRLSATDYDKKPLEFFSIVLDSAKIVEGATYKIRNGYLGEFAGYYWIGSDQQKTFRVKEPLTGVIRFKKFDEISLIASGNFEFNAINLMGDTLHVSSGRFDVRYTL